MLGHMFGDIVKVFLSLAGGVIMFLLIQKHITAIDSIWITFLPIAISMLGLFLQIGTNFANLLGMIGDVATFCYGIDLKI